MATPCLLLLSKVCDVLARPSRAQQYRALIARDKSDLFEEADTSDYRKVLGHPSGVDRDHLGARDRVMTWLRDDDGETLHLPFHMLPGIIPEGAVGSDQQFRRSSTSFVCHHNWTAEFLAAAWPVE